MIQTSEFSKVHIGDVVVLLGLLIAYAQYRMDRNKQDTEKQKDQKDLADRHAANVSRLDSLKDFHQLQLKINDTHNESLQELKIQTATLGKLAEGQERRLQRLEDRHDV